MKCECGHEREAHEENVGKGWCVFCPCRRFRGRIEDFPERIPAAIKKAEGLTVSGDYECRPPTPVSYIAEPEEDYTVVAITTTEVALAAALWSLTESGDCGQFPPDAALIAFCDKVEGL